MPIMIGSLFDGRRRFAATYLLTRRALRRVDSTWLRGLSRAEANRHHSAAALCILAKRRLLRPMASHRRMDILPDPNAVGFVELTALVGLGLGSAVLATWITRSRRRRVEYAPRSQQTEQNSGADPHSEPHSNQTQSAHRPEPAATDSETSEPAAEALLVHVVEANTQLYQRLGHAENMLKKQAGELSAYMSEARTDPLTGLPNRRAFDEEMSRRIADWNRRQIPLSVVMIDIDHFKRVNDVHGHQAGDAVLKQMSDTLLSCVREADFVARLGGEELAITMPATAREYAEAVAERCRIAVHDATCVQHGHTLRISASFGVACCLPGETPEQLLRRADEALYAAKENGRNRTFWHDGVATLPVTPPKNIEASRAMTNPTPATDGVRSEPSSEQHFAQVCQDLRQRLIDVLHSES